ncbi:DEBR0S6_01134g1_1 [Brettanomyces bruxellensis]|uniref:DEBR0S6_01134g1_1 n=1 Tax=Dekkera bruxellensis TaxID=5007 RepID=A0A7D9H2E3_DEKBR|nr:DEBR0S6_01134g1_1 [Brettanomyces bruxellensis]
MNEIQEDVSAALADQHFTTYNWLRNKYYSYTDLSSILEIYAFGTISDYFHNKSLLPALNKAQLSRLRQLTLVGLAEDSVEISFDKIRAELCLESQTWLADLIDLNNPVVIKFKIDELEQVIRVEDIFQTRDVFSSQDMPLRILSFDQVSFNVSKMINALKFIRDVKLAKVTDALKSKKDLSAEAVSATRRSSQLKRRLEG